MFPRDFCLVAGGVGLAACEFGCTRHRIIKLGLPPLSTLPTSVHAVSSGYHFIWPSIASLLPRIIQCPNITPTSILPQIIQCPNITPASIRIECPCARDKHIAAIRSAVLLLFRLADMSECLLQLPIKRQLLQCITGQRWGIKCSGLSPKPLSILVYYCI